MAIDSIEPPQRHRFFNYLAPSESADERVVSRVGIVHVGEPEGRSRVAEAGLDSTNPNEMRVGEPKFRQLEPDQLLAQAAGRSGSCRVTATVPEAGQSSL
jgi:hypothetical protein